MEKRKLERIELPRTILVRSGTLGYADSAAVLKDISAAGAYFLTLMALARGEVVELFVTLHDAEGTLHLSFTGTVVRVEKCVTDNSLGVAVKFSGFRELDDDSGRA